MCFSAAVASENDHGSMNLASNTAPIGCNTSPAALQWSSPQVVPSLAPPARLQDEHDLASLSPEAGFITA
jgi:hypothetical protein